MQRSATGRSRIPTQQSSRISAPAVVSVWRRACASRAPPANAVAAMVVRNAARAPGFWLSRHASSDAIKMLLAHAAFSGPIAMQLSSRARCLTVASGYATVPMDRSWHRRRQQRADSGRCAHAQCRWHEGKRERPGDDRVEAQRDRPRGAPSDGSAEHDVEAGRGGEGQSDRAPGGPGPVQLDRAPAAGWWSRPRPRSATCRSRARPARGAPRKPARMCVAWLGWGALSPSQARVGA